MSLPQSFDKSLSERTDEELYDMLAHGEDYVSEALAAAQVEIERRNLTPSRVKELELHEEVIEAQAARQAQEPLSWPLRLIMALLPFGLIQLVVSEGYRKEYPRKYRECWSWMWYGVGCWLVFFCCLSAVPSFFRSGAHVLIYAVMGIVAFALIRWFCRRATKS